jgi:hypothetical protein
LTALKIVYLPELPRIFLNETSYFDGLIKIFEVYPIAFFSKPLGAFFFQSLSRHFDLLFLLKISHVGTGLCTAFLGLVGLLFPEDFFWGFIVYRFFQPFFAATEVVGVSTSLLDQQNSNETSSQIAFSSMVGIFSAFFLAAVFKAFKGDHLGFCCNHLLGFLMVLSPLILGKKSMVTICSEVSSFLHFRHFFQVFALFGFSSLCYSLTFVVFPTIMSLNLQSNYSCIIASIDCLVIFLAGKFFKNHPSKNPINLSLWMGIASIFVFSHLKIFALATYFFHSLYLVIGCLFSTHLYAFVHQKFKGKNGFGLYSWGYVLGSQFFGSFTPVLLFRYFPQQDQLQATIITVAIISFILLIAIRYEEVNLENQQILEQLE